LKTLSATSARATELSQQAGRSSDRRPSLTNAEFALSGPSNPPDPLRHAYRKDLADVALAGQVIASHYAEPLARALATAAELRSGPDEGSEVLAKLDAGAAFDLLDDSLGWAWGYAGEDRLVGYVRSEQLAAS
jgi:hypothetical protein